MKKILMLLLTGYLPYMMTSVPVSRSRKLEKLNQDDESMSVNTAARKLDAMQKASLLLAGKLPPVSDGSKSSDSSEVSPHNKKEEEESSQIDSTALNGLMSELLSMSAEQKSKKSPRSLRRKNTVGRSTGPKSPRIKKPSKRTGDSPLSSKSLKDRFKRSPHNSGGDTKDAHTDAAGATFEGYLKQTWDTHVTMLEGGEEFSVSVFGNVVTEAYNRASSQEELRKFLICIRDWADPNKSLIATEAFKFLKDVYGANEKDDKEYKKRTTLKKKLKNIEPSETLGRRSDSYLEKLREAFQGKLYEIAKSHRGNNPAVCITESAFAQIILKAIQQSSDNNETLKINLEEIQVWVQDNRDIVTKESAVLLREITKQLKCSQSAVQRLISCMKALARFHGNYLTQTWETHAKMLEDEEFSVTAFGKVVTEAYNSVSSPDELRPLLLCIRAWADAHRSLIKADCFKLLTRGYMANEKDPKEHKKRSALKAKLKTLGDLENWKIRQKARAKELREKTNSMLSEIAKRYKANNPGDYIDEGDFHQIILDVLAIGSNKYEEMVCLDAVQVWIDPNVKDNYRHIVSEESAVTLLTTMEELENSSGKQSAKQSYYDAIVKRKESRRKLGQVRMEGMMSGIIDYGALVAAPQATKRMPSTQDLKALIEAVGALDALVIIAVTPVAYAKEKLQEEFQSNRRTAHSDPIEGHVEQKELPVRPVAKSSPLMNQVTKQEEESDSDDGVIILPKTSYDDNPTPEPEPSPTNSPPAQSDGNSLTSYNARHTVDEPTQYDPDDTVFEFDSSVQGDAEVHHNPLESVQGSVRGDTEALHDALEQYSSSADDEDVTSAEFNPNASEMSDDSFYGEPKKAQQTTGYFPESVVRLPHDEDTIATADLAELCQSTTEDTLPMPQKKESWLSKISSKMKSPRGKKGAVVMFGYDDLESEQEAPKKAPSALKTVNSKWQANVEEGLLRICAHCRKMLDDTSSKLGLQCEHKIHSACYDKVLKLPEQTCGICEQPVILIPRVKSDQYTEVDEPSRNNHDTLEYFDEMVPPSEEAPPPPRTFKPLPQPPTKKAPTPAARRPAAKRAPAKKSSRTNTPNSRRRAVTLGKGKVVMENIAARENPSVQPPQDDSEFSYSYDPDRAGGTYVRDDGGYQKEYDDMYGNAEVGSDEESTTPLPEESLKFLEQLRKNDQGQ